MPGIESAIITSIPQINLNLSLNLNLTAPYPSSYIISCCSTWLTSCDLPMTMKCVPPLMTTG